MFKIVCVSLSMLSASASAFADPGYYVVTAYDNQGQRTIDVRYWTVKRAGSPATLWPEIGVGYGVTSRWYTELYASFIGTADTAMKRSTLNWQNEYLLTQGQYPVDVALHVALIKSHDAEDGNSVEIGPVLQTDVGRYQLNGNLFFEHTYHASDYGGTQLKYQWQVKYRWKPALNFGAQGFGELGDWDHWAPSARQSHRAGPALFGMLPMGNEQALLYQAAYLAGSTYGHRSGMFSMRVQYVF